MMRSVVFILVAAIVGGGIGLFRSNSEAGLRFRQQIGMVIPQASQDAPKAREHQTFFAPQFVTSNPQSIVDNFAVDGKSDPMFDSCLRDAGAADPKGMEELADRHDHKITTTLVHCLLSSDRQRFCNAGKRQEVAAAMELYLWSRDYNFNNRASLDERYRVEHPKEYLEDGQATADPWYKTWDGPADRAIYDDLKALVRRGYVDAEAIGKLPRSEIRQALTDITSDYTPCEPTMAKGL